MIGELNPKHRWIYLYLTDFFLTAWTLWNTFIWLEVAQEEINNKFKEK